MVGEALNTISRQQYIRAAGKAPQICPLFLQALERCAHVLPASSLLQPALTIRFHVGQWHVEPQIESCLGRTKAAYFCGLPVRGDSVPVRATTMRFSAFPVVVRRRLCDTGKVKYDRGMHICCLAVA